MNKTSCLLFSLCINAFLFAQTPQFVISAPAGSQFTTVNQTGTSIIPNGRLITPAGKSIITAPHPYGLILSKDGSLAVTANSGTNPLSINIIHNISTENPKVIQVPPGPATDKGVLASVFMGLAVSPDNKLIYVAGGQENKIYLFNAETGEGCGTIDCSFKNDSIDYTHGYIGDMVLSSSGQWLYAIDQIGFRLITIDVFKQKLVSNVPTGRYPFGIALSPDEKNLYVANVGMYKYSKIKQKQYGEWKDGTVDFPAFAYGSKEAEEGIKNDTLFIPGLGPLNSDESFSVWTYRINKYNQPTPGRRIKTGVQIGQMVEGIPAVGGSSPNSIVATEKYVFISNGTNDNITVLDASDHKVLKHIKLTINDNLNHLRGIIPFGLCLSTDEKRLFVTESGINAIAVIDIPTLSLIGHIPAGWFPARVKAMPGGKHLVVANAKGFGSGKNGGADFKPGPEGTYIGSLMKGSISLIDIPCDSCLKQTTQQVISNNFLIQPYSEVSGRRNGNPVPVFPGEKSSPIKHIVFISKENRTYDEIFGQLSGANGDSTIARYGYGRTFTNRSKTSKVTNATIMPNHLKLAKEFGFSDNFYVDSDVSADGHRWLVNTYPNEWVEATTPAGYGGNRDYREKSEAPGNLGMNSSAGAIYPEDYNEAGSMWDHLTRHTIDYYNFGFSVMFEPADYKNEYKIGGVKHLANFPLPSSLFTRTSHTYPTYNMAIPDQFRIDMFIKEFNAKWGTQPDSLPAVLTVIIPNDHGAGERPDAGYPYRESYMADNDLAVGRIVEFLSHTPAWKDMMIVITEDDAQNGIDHVDAHRSVLMVISPWSQRHHVSHVHYSFGSIFKTFWNILGIPYLNQYDAGANDFSDFFATVPDFTPYNAVPVDVRIFDPQKALDPLDEKFDWKQLKESPEIDKTDDMLRESKEQDEWRLKQQ